MSISKLQMALLRYELRKLQGWMDLIAEVRRVEPKPEPEQVPERVKATRDWEWAEIMTKKNVFDRFMEKVAPEPSCGCWLWLGAMYRGYGYISAYGRNSRVHRVSWELHKGPIPSGLVVMHKCDNSICVNPDHLMIGTQAENLNDMRIKGRGGYRITRYTLKFYRGSKHRNSKLNEAKVIEIKRRLLNGETQSHLAEVFCISRRSIFSIIKGKTWRHVEAKNISNALIPSYMSGEISVPRVHKEGDANDLGE